jgi:nicotinic acid mononucleotide adenylyltransferase
MESNHRVESCGPSPCTRPPDHKIVNFQKKTGCIPNPVVENIRDRTRWERFNWAIKFVLCLRSGMESNHRVESCGPSPCTRPPDHKIVIHQKILVIFPTNWLKISSDKIRWERLNWAIKFVLCLRSGMESNHRVESCGPSPCTRPPDHKIVIHQKILVIFPTNWLKISIDKIRWERFNWAIKFVLCLRSRMDSNHRKRHCGPLPYTRPLDLGLIRQKYL